MTGSAPELQQVGRQVDDDDLVPATAMDGGRGGVMWGCHLTRSSESEFRAAEDWPCARPRWSGCLPGECPGLLPSPGGRNRIDLASETIDSPEWAMASGGVPDIEGRLWAHRRLLFRVNRLSGNQEKRDRVERRFTLRPFDRCILHRHGVGRCSQLDLELEQQWLRSQGFFQHQPQCIRLGCRLAARSSQRTGISPAGRRTRRSRISFQDSRVRGPGR